MNADHAAQLRLLDLQATDTALAQLRHRRASLPELAAIKERSAAAAELRHRVVDAETATADLAGEQRRLENEVELVRNRATRDEQRLQSGGVPAKELSGLQHELTSLARRQGTLEDELLEVMERVEESESTMRTLRSEHDQIAAVIGDLEAKRDAALVEIDAAVAERSAQRTAIAAGLPADLLAVYDKAAQHNGGTGGAAELRQRRCEGCRIELSGSELSAVRTAAPDDVVRCDNCRRILVRTAESGL